MSTFTRLYFINRGPSLAERDEAELDAGSEEVGSPDLAPSAPDADAVDTTAWGRLRQLSLSHLSTAPEHESLASPRWATDRDPEAGKDMDFES